MEVEVAPVREVVESMDWTCWKALATECATGAVIVPGGG
jgi:hypothetical protein